MSYLRVSKQMNILLLLNKYNGCLKENVIPCQNLRVPKTELCRKAKKACAE